MARALVNTINKPISNYLINGNFYYWQRILTFTGLLSGGQYYCDRWRFTGTASGTATLARTAFTVGQTDVPGNPVYYMKYNQTVAATGTACSMDQRVEDVTLLSGKTVYLSFYARNNSGPLNITGNFVQNFGTGGSPSAQVVVGTPTFALTTSWQKFTATIVIPSVAGKTLGSNNDSYTGIGFSLPTTGTWNIDIAQVMLSEQASEFKLHGADQADELRHCQRYYEKSYESNILPGTVGATSSSLQFQRSASAASDSWSLQFKVQKRTGPTVRVYSTNTGAVDNVRDLSAGVDRAATVVTGGTNNCVVQTTVAVAVGSPHAWHFTAEAEL